MKFNKKGLMMLPLAALLFTSCSHWKDVTYQEAYDFIHSNYGIDKVLPKKVHETFKADVDGRKTTETYAEAYAKQAFFYSDNIELDWTRVLKKCNYDADYTPIEGDSRLGPIDEDYTYHKNNPDELIPNDGTVADTVTYQIDKKQFKQTISITTIAGDLTLNRSITYNDKGYRIEIVGNCKADGEIPDPTSEGEGTVNAKFSFDFKSTYTY